MNFLPAENITYKTRLKSDEVIKRLCEIVEPEKAFRFGMYNSVSAKLYEGEINDRLFSIKRIISYRNSFLPKINGIIEKGFEGTIIKIKMRLHIVVVVFLCIWCGGIGLGCMAVLTQAFGNSDFNVVTLVPFVMLLFAYGLTMGGFKFESIKSKKYLQALFEADIIDE